MFEFVRVCSSSTDFDCILCYARRLMTTFSPLRHGISSIIPDGKKSRHSPDLSFIFAFSNFRTFVPPFRLPTAIDVENEFSVGFLTTADADAQSQLPMSSTTPPPCLIRPHRCDPWSNRSIKTHLCPRPGETSRVKGFRKNDD